MSMLKTCLYIIFFRYYGGKNNHKIINAIRALIPEHKIYGEPYAGSLGTLLNKVRAEKEYVYDADRNIVNLHQVMADPLKGAILKERLKNIEVTKAEFNYIKQQEFRGYQGLDDIEKAVCTYKLLVFSFNSCRKNFRGIEKEEYQKWITKSIDKVYERMQGVDVKWGNAMNMIEEFKRDENAFLFLDPPYCSWLRSEGATNIYTVEANLRDQTKLLKAVVTSDVKAKIMICGYYSGKGKNDFYDSILLRNGWTRVKLAEVTKTAASVTKEGTKPKGIEYVWINYPVPNNTNNAIFLEKMTFTKWNDLFNKQ